VQERERVVSRACILRSRAQSTSDLFSFYSKDLLALLRSEASIERSKSLMTHVSVLLSNFTVFRDYAWPASFSQDELFGLVQRKRAIMTRRVPQNITVFHRCCCCCCLPIVSINSIAYIASQLDSLSPRTAPPNTEK